MNCDSGSHRFRPFKRSRDLFCTECGFIKTESHRSDKQQILERPAILDLESSISQERDPYREEAERILAHTDFERSVTQILNDVGAAGHMRNALYQVAVDFGPTLDLEVFRKHASENVERIPVEEDLEKVLDETFGDA